MSRMPGDIFSSGWEQVTEFLRSILPCSKKYVSQMYDVEMEISDLHHEAKNGNVGEVEALLEQPDIQVNEEKEINGLSYTPLLIAAKYGHDKVVELLLKVDDIQVNLARKSSGCTPLYMAAQNGHLEVVEKILQKYDIDVNKTKHEATPLMIAASNGHEKIVELLLRRDDIAPAINKACCCKCTPLYLAAQNGFEQIVHQLMGRNDTDVNQTSYMGATALLIAARNGHRKVVENLLRRKDIQVNKPWNVTGATPLFLATQWGHASVVNLLLNHRDIQVNKAGHRGINPLIVAHNNKDVELVGILLEKVTKPVYQNSECLVCLDRRPNVVLIPCGHQNLCGVCASRWKKQGKGCPLDRMTIGYIHKFPAIQFNSIKFSAMYTKYKED